MTQEAPNKTEAKLPDPAQLARARALASAAYEKQAEDVVALDVNGLTSLADTFLIASGRSRQQVRAIADGVQEAARRDGIRSLGAEGETEGVWALLDFGSVIFHVFLEDTRRHYDLERLWADAPRMDVEPAELKQRRAR
ncbi:MAG: ribosome silencing factor [Deltaproteobacteria bacterium]|nr:ribosome silencing factor [Deltaproteobacteria bacterium]